MKVGFVEMKPLFELTYNQGYEDAKNEMYAPVERRTTRYTLNSTAEIIKETVKVLFDLGLEGFGIGVGDEDDKCLVLWCDRTFTTTYTHEPEGGSTMVDVNKVYDNAEEFLEVIKKELLNLPKEKEMQTNTKLSISELTDLIHTGNVKAGWWGLHSEDGSVLDLAEMIRNPKSLLEERFAMALVAEKLCLTHSEISEGMEGLRKNLMDDKLPHRSMLEVELADAVIRTIDLCGALGLDLEGAIFEKLAFNKVRPDHKVENRLKENGKKF